ncbi:RDD family protein [Streptomyces sp. NPDC051018]|uniref:RDD family protein n=1 Tax=Streptomyces sp. NPDC051018 TaxID=3365639 RepID=UPI003790FBC5
MSAPTPHGGDGSPTPGYYPDPSIPGYVRYWNGAAWVPGTSRPAPKDDDAAASPDPARPAADRTPAQSPVQSPAPAVAPARDSAARDSASVRDTAPARDTGRTPGRGTNPPPPGAGTLELSASARTPAPVSAAPSAPASPPAPGPGAAAASAPAQLEETGPVFLDEEPSDQPSRPEPATAWQATTSRQTGFGGERDNRVAWGGPEPATPSAPSADPRVPAQGASPSAGAPAGDPSGGALPGVRSTAPGAQREAAALAQPPRTAGDSAAPEHTVTIRAQGSRSAAGQQPEQALSVRSMTPGAAPAAPLPTAPAPAPAPARPQAPERPGTAQPDPVTPGSGGGSASWAQQVHQLARPEGEQPVAPWKPPADDPFLRAAQAQAAARPAPLGRRLAARLIDSVVLGALVGAVAVPVLSRTVTHIDEKIEAAKQSGETVTVWLVDGTTGVHLAIVLGALLVLGALYEALPTAKWGRTLGKKLCGLTVVDIESHEPPSFGTALRRWLVYSVLGLIVVGVVNVLWALVDRPWRQCWHDKAAHTFVTRRPADGLPRGG